MPITEIVTTNTFRDWFNKTNEIIDKLNSGSLVDGIVANGAFTVNGSLLVVNTFLANSTTVDLRGNTTVTANVFVDSSCNVWEFAAGTLLIQPLDGTLVNTDITINAAATFLLGLVANANVSITADTDITGNVLVNGTFTANAGPIVAVQVLFASDGAIIVPANLTNPEYDDFQPAGGDAAEVWNLTPSIDTVLTGIAAPTGFVTGARILYLQNISTGFQITLSSSNTNSQLHNRFKTPQDADAQLAPGGAVALIWSSTNNQWRVLAPATTTVPTLNVTGNVSIGGLLTQTGNATFSGYVNIASTLQVTGNTQLGNTQVNGWMNVTSYLQIAANANIVGALLVSGNAAVSGNLSVTGNVSVTGNLEAGSLNASSLLAGTVNTARLATGTANLHTYLLGDQTWQQRGIVRSARLAANATFSNLVDVNYVTAGNNYTLPAGTANRVITVKNFSAADVTVNRTGADTIESLSATTFVIPGGSSGGFFSITFVFDSTDAAWLIV